MKVHRVSDRTFLLHLGGKLEVNPTVPLKTRDDMSMAYTPGVARVCLALADKPEDASSLTIKGNTVAIVTDGTAVLGLGDIGPTAALPVMEGKAALFKSFAGVDAWPVCLDTQDTEEIISIVEAMAPGVRRHQPRGHRRAAVLRDRGAAARVAGHPGLPRRPARHGDRGAGRAEQRAAAGRQAASRTSSVAMAGAGAAGVAITKLLLREGVGDVRVCDRHGIIRDGEQQSDSSKQWFAEHTNTDRRTGSVMDALDGADVFIGVSGPNLFDASELARMNDDAIVFALANPDPEVDPSGAMDHAAVVATGRSDYPNQINNVLAFPGIFRGALDARARNITEEMKVAAARAIADVVDPRGAAPRLHHPQRVQHRRGRRRGRRGPGLRDGLRRSRGHLTRSGARSPRGPLRGRPGRRGRAPPRGRRSGGPARGAPPRRCRGRGGR